MWHEAHQVTCSGAVAPGSGHKKTKMAEQAIQDVLIVSSDAELIRQALGLLASRGLRGTVHNGSASARPPTARRWDLALIDLQSTGPAGYSLVRDLRADNPELPVVMVSQEELSVLAGRAARCGCVEFLAKPVTESSLSQVLGSMLPNHKVVLAAGRADAVGAYQMVGKSPRLLEVVRQAMRVAPTSVPVLVCGESGTGKELLASLLHSDSRRADGPCIRVNCAALSESLLESELFGHERGAFTGAIMQRKGKFELAHGGTLLLDEIAETGPRLQAELLRVLEQQDFERVGGSETVRVNVRVISTSNRDLAAEVASGRFRRDLYYRISGVKLSVPPLRERTEDIPLLVWHFINLYTREVGRTITELDPAMLDLLTSCPWPGNVRQLRNVIRTALILGDGPELSLKPMPSLVSELTARESVRRLESDDLSLRDIERRAILEALRRTQRNQAKAARMLGITDRTLREKLRRYSQEDQPLALTGENRW